MEVPEKTYTDEDGKIVWGRGALKLFAEFEEYYAALSQDEKEAMRNRVWTVRTIRDDGTVVGDDPSLPPRYPALKTKA